ncbi:MAG: hypothetical protein ACXVCP_15910 [Bdellovibrio sp.]
MSLRKSLLQVIRFIALTNVFLSVCLTSTAKEKAKVALLINASQITSSTSNNVEEFQKKGLSIAIEEFENNAIAYKWIDVGENTEKVISSVEEIKKFNPQLVIGCSHSFQAIALLELLKKEHLSVPVMFPAATSDKILTYPNTLMISNSNSIQAEILSKQAKRKSRALVINISDCVYCTDLAERIFKKLKGRGITASLLSIEENKIETFDINSIKENFDHVFIPALELDTAKLARIISKKLPTAEYWAGDGVGTLARYFQMANDSKIKFKWLSHYHTQINTSQNKKFLKRYRSKYGSEPNDTAVFYYEALKIGINRIILNDKSSTNNLITGPARFQNHQVIRPMPLLTLSDKGPLMIRNINP